MKIAELSPREAFARQQDGAVLLDVRERFEQATGMAAGARALPLDDVAVHIGTLLADRSTEVLVICASGRRSMQAAELIADAGYTHVASVAGGTARWLADALPITRPAGDQDFYERYSRNLRLPEIGEAGQRKLEAARVVLLGAGGLGSPAAMYLAAAGVGTLVIADHDVVERSNLQRQILHTDARIGMPKVASAHTTLTALNPRVNVVAVGERITARNVEGLLDGADVVIDGADNFPVRYLLNDACVKLAKPLVYGAVQQFDGQVSVFDAGRQRGIAPCYRCLYPQPPAAGDAPNCSEAGVLGVLPGFIGMLQATEALKLVLGIGKPLIGRLLLIDALGMHFRELRVAANPTCPSCAPGRAFSGYIDDAPSCAEPTGYPVAECERTAD
jgi:molybdopterin/thiamine biosynthesis adenylyltransferase